MLHIFMSAVFLAALVVLVVIVFVYLVIRPPRVVRIVTGDVEQPKMDYKGETHPPFETNRGNPITQKVMGALEDGVETVIENFARLSAVPRIGDWTYAPITSHVMREEGDLAVANIARERTPSGTVIVGSRLPSPLQFSSTCKAYCLDSTRTIVYGLSPVDDTQHLMARHYLWCQALESTGIAPKVHFLSGPAQSGGSYMHRNQVDDRFLIMENVGTSLEQIFAQRDNPRSITLIASVVRALHSLHSVGVVNGNVEERTVFVRADGRVVLTDFGLASQIGASSTSTRRDDLIAAAELLDDAIPLMKEGLGSRYPRIDDPPTQRKIDADTRRAALMYRPVIEEIQAAAAAEVPQYAKILALLARASQLRF